MQKYSNLCLYLKKFLLLFLCNLTFKNESLFCMLPVSILQNQHLSYYQKTFWEIGKLRQNQVMPKESVNIQNSSLVARRRTCDPCIFLFHQQILWNLPKATPLVPLTWIYLPSVAAPDKTSTNPPLLTLLRQFKHQRMRCEGKIFQPGWRTVRNPCRVFTFPTSPFSRLLPLILY